MPFTWDLTSFFEDDVAFYKKIEDVNQMIHTVEESRDSILNDMTLLALLNKREEIREQANNILIYGSLKYYKNIKEEHCITLKKDAETFHNEVNLKLSFIDQKVLDLGLEQIKTYIHKNKDLKIYEQSLLNLFRRQEHVKNEEITKKISENCNAINELLTTYNAKLRDIHYGEIEIDGKVQEITASNFAKYMASRNRETRKQAYFSVNQSFKEEEEFFATVLNEIYGYRIENANLEQYGSVLEKSLYEENIDPEIVSTLIQVVHQKKDCIQEYLRLKARFLHIDEAHLYDFGVPLDTDVKTKYSLEEAIEIIKNALKPLGDKYLEVLDILLDGHIDAEPDEKKHQSIIFSWNTYSFMNFRGSYGDLKNLIHEIGHIVHYYLSKEKLPFLYEDSTIFVAEVASTVNEILLNRYLFNQAESKEEKFFYLSKEIENYFVYVFKQTMYTEFENALYEKRETEDLTASYLSEKYGEMIKSYYGDFVFYDEIANIEWTRLGHLYRWSYYPYKYATGLLMASMVVNGLVDEKTIKIEQYLEFLSSGSCMYPLELLKKIAIDLTDSTVMEYGFTIVENDIKELKKLF
jgi:oligoendopeptidase F